MILILIFAALWALYGIIEELANAVVQDEPNEWEDWTDEL